MWLLSEHGDCLVANRLRIIPYVICNLMFTFLVDVLNIFRQQCIHDATSTNAPVAAAMGEALPRLTASRNCYISVSADGSPEDPCE